MAEGNLNVQNPANNMGDQDVHQFLTTGQRAGQVTHPGEEEGHT